jgi:hypothetical protein
MRLVPILVLSLSLAACDKKPPASEGGGSAGVAAKSDPATKTEPKKEEPKKEEPPKPVTKTGILDLEMQEVPGGYKLITPRFTQFFTSKPQVQRQDAQTPFGDTIPGGVAIIEGGDRFAGLIYIPIPKDIPYDVAKGLKGARDGMLGMFEGKYDAKDDKTKLGPLDANHVVADGSRGGHKFHVEAWIAYDEGGRTVYGLMSLRMPTDLEGVDKLKEGFELRADAAPALPPTEGDKDAAGKDAKPVKKSEAPKKPGKAPAVAQDGI